MIRAWIIRCIGIAAFTSMFLTALTVIMESSPYSGGAFISAWILGFGAFVVLIWALCYADLLVNKD